jgi:hypothetical protein
LTVQNRRRPAEDETLSNNHLCPIVGKWSAGRITWRADGTKDVFERGVFSMRHLTLKVQSHQCTN